MEIIKIIIGVTLTGLSFIGALLGALSARFSILTIIILSILKLLGLVAIPWFASIFVLSVIGTGLWMLTIGLIIWVLGIFSALIISMQLAN